MAKVDAHEITAEEYEEIPELDFDLEDAEIRIGDRVIRPGRPPLDPLLRKQPVSIRLSPDVLNAFRETGPGWQTRIDEALRDWLKGRRSAS
jgi:uncharacterized protein (DUF4415 family)